MTTELSIYQRMPDPLAAIQVLGDAIHGSQMFGCENVSQGRVLATEVLARGKPILMLFGEYHIMFNRLTKKAEAILADFNRLGGEHQIHSRTAELADIELFWKGKKYRSAFSWADAQQEPFVYIGKEKDVVPLLLAGKKPILKDKYATPRSRMQMLWARSISDGVKAICPQACQGVYTPEEVSDFDGNGDGDDSEVLDAEYTVTSETESQLQTSAQASAATNGVANGAANGKAETKPTEQQSRSDRIGDAMIRQIFELAYAVVGKNGDAAAEYLKQHGVSNVAELSPEQAGGLLEKLKTAKVPSKKTEAAASAKPEAVAVKETDPATETQVARAKSLLKELEQVKSGTVARFGELLAASGRKKIADLTVAQCDELIRKLVAKEMEAFFTESLKPKN